MHDLYRKLLRFGSATGVSLKVVFAKTCFQSKHLVLRCHLVRFLHGFFDHFLDVFKKTELQNGIFFRSQHCKITALIDESLEISQH